MEYQLAEYKILQRDDDPTKNYAEVSVTGPVGNLQRSRLELKVKVKVDVKGAIISELSKRKINVRCIIPK